MKTTLTLSAAALLLATTALAAPQEKELEEQPSFQIASLADRIQNGGFWSTLASWDYDDDDHDDDDDDDRYDDDDYDDDDYDDDDRDDDRDDDGDDD